ncbi:anhydro-N-acetylmuramic acid kinase [Undibacterium pigrum]|uniref:Anhydro-N-acetylmuramic acid kinase n=1 Tax=Undibacterium pigrum TaxID=401470 RepID=A0A318IRL5_9BURK|nr:anhydro-N-acetylmuramic acid kinase [Undibacterium pigrum]PXX35314.1 anhydro-N-acetylmuramic acid kinase [Undibacterium pigrum]
MSTQHDKNNSNTIYIGLMSGTSLDGVDGVMVRLPECHEENGAGMHILATAYIPFDADLRQQAMRLQQASENELHHEALLANALAKTYATCVKKLQALAEEQVVHALGVHGQTIRHRPELGYTRQTNNPSLLAELTGIDVIADFRSRDIAAGGQGAPLVPAFHRAVFGRAGASSVVANIGGISNISILAADGSTRGFDTGPGNVLMDAWMLQHQGKSYDANGDWAAQGNVIPSLLANLMDEAYLQMPPPKSTGRDLFHSAWLHSKLQGFEVSPPADVQATLCEFTALTLANDIASHARDATHVYVCGGGAYNRQLMQRLQVLLSTQSCKAIVNSTAVLGVAPEQVEALAFAWLAQRFCLRLPGNLADVTGATGGRILGALYPA